MNEHETTATVETPPATAPKAKKARKSAKPSANGAAKQPKHPFSMRLAQVRILRLLAKGGQDRASIVKKAEFDTTWFGEYVGSSKGPKAWKAAKARMGFPNLLLLGLVKETELDVDGVKERFFDITAAGKKTLRQIDK